MAEVIYILFYLATSLCYFMYRCNVLASKCICALRDYIIPYCIYYACALVPSLPLFNKPVYKGMYSFVSPVVSWIAINKV